MTKTEMMCWLQDVIDDSKNDASFSCDCSDVWSDLENWMLDIEEIQWVFDPYLHKVYFLCDDGILSTILDFGVDGKTIWIVPEYNVDTCVFQADKKDVEESVRNAKEVLVELLAFKKLIDGQRGIDV